MTKEVKIRVAVVIPWRPTESRIPLKEYVESWYHTNLPDADVLFIDSGHTYFNRSASRNKGSALSLDYDVIVHNDADTVPSLEPLLSGIEKTYKTGFFSNPYSSYRMLDFENTQKVINQEILIGDAEYNEIPGACSGIVITTPKTFYEINGYDENFKEWGYEDIAIAIAHATILEAGFHIIPGVVYAMSHKIDERIPELLNYGKDRMDKYSAALGNKQLVINLIKENNE